MVTTQNSVLPGGVHVLLALPDGSPGASSVPLLLVSAKAWITLSPGSDAVKQNFASPKLSVVAEPLDGFERSEEHTSELQSHHDLVCRLLLEKKKQQKDRYRS